MLNRKLFIAFVLAVVSASIAPAWAVTMRINTPEIEVTLAPGEAKSGTVGVDNPTDTDIVVRVYTEDWSYKPTGAGDKNFFVAGTLPQSASKWVVLSEAEFTLPPFAHRDLNYTMTVPREGASGTHHTVIFFETNAGTASSGDGASVAVAARLGTICRITIAGTSRREGKVTDIRITPPQGSKPAEIVTAFKNSGNTDIITKGNILIMDREGLVKGRGNLEDIMTEAGQEVTRTSTWAGKLAAGEYDVILTYDLGEGQLLTEERKMVVENAPQG